MKQNLTVHKIKSILKMLSLPIIVFLVMNTIDLMVTGQGVISSGTDVRALFRNILTTFSFALAINCNLRVGRMDLSLGSQMYLACIFGGNLALQMNLGGIGVLAFSMGLGLLCGLLVGTLYVQLRILPMIFGIGMSLIFECLSFGAYNQQGLMLYGKPVISILSEIWFVITVTLGMIAVMTFLFQYSTFGYTRRAIQGNQKLANDSGINIYVNAVREAYPDLKANEVFENLQAQLEGTENRVEMARHSYIETVKNYNLRVKRFPGSIVAGLFGFDAMQQYEADQAAQTAPKVKF